MKDIREYLHLYLGCECLLPDGNVYTLEAVYRGGWPLVRDPIGGGVVHYPPSDFKLILRPLSDMTEEERSVYLGYWGNEKPLDVKVSIKREAFATNYLLSKHFDLFVLIEARLAIDATTLKDI